MKRVVTIWISSNLMSLNVLGEVMIMLQNDKDPREVNPVDPRIMGSIVAASDPRQAGTTLTPANAQSSTPLDPRLQNNVSPVPTDPRLSG